MNADTIIRYLTPLSFLLGLVFVITPSIIKYKSKNNLQLIAKSKFLYLPVYFFVLAGVFGLLYLMDLINIYIEILFYILLSGGLISVSRVAKQMNT